VSSHSLLSNLSSDDHPQYLTEDRANLLYYTQSEVDTIVAGLADPYLEVFTLDSTAIADKKITLSNTPSSSTTIRFLPDGGIEQRFSVDYDLNGNDIIWDGLELDGFLEVGDVVRIYYSA
jgi:hypothetical protein